MSDLPPESRPLPPPDPDQNPTQALPVEGSTAPAAHQPVTAPAKQRLRDRLWSFRAVIAVALASVIIGGLGGAALASVSEGGDDGRFGPGQGRFNRGGPGGPPGMMNRGPGRRNPGPDRRGMGQRHWEYGDGPGVQPGGPPVPSPSPSN